MPAKGYASHGESWSYALALRLASYELLRSDLGEDPVLVLDDVFAELDTGRRERLAELVAGRPSRCWSPRPSPADVPDALSGAPGRRPGRRGPPCFLTTCQSQRAPRPALS